MNRIVRTIAVVGAVAIAAPVFAVGLEGCKKKSKGGTSQPSKPPPRTDAGKKSALLPRAGTTALSHRLEAQDTGAEVEGIICDADNEGTAWCNDENHITVCVSGHFYKLACSSTGKGNVCAEEVDNSTVDCEPVEETE
ncbi:hypothetical protein [Pendulispora albinea]|uniref:Uncharacterized protein n=1 Tax=Pendulispora albinea TaxID=2741071 RepID=A0ABZ2MC58_9BACT